MTEKQKRELEKFAKEHVEECAQQASIILALMFTDDNKATVRRKQAEVLLGRKDSLTEEERAEIRKNFKGDMGKTQKTIDEKIKAERDIVAKEGD